MERENYKWMNRLAKSLVFSFLIVFGNGLVAQDTCGVYGGTINLTTQEEVDNWGGCECLLGDLILSGSIMNTDSLSTLNYIDGSIQIKPLLNSSFELDLSDLDSVSGSIYLTSGSINSLSGLGQIANIGGDLILRNTDIVNFDGLVSLKSIGGGLVLDRNTNLIDINGLGSLVELSSLFLSENSSLVSIAGLNQIKELNSLNISLNYSLIDLTGLESLENIKGVNFIYYHDLDSSSLSFAFRNFNLYNNSSLEDINSLKKLREINSSVSIDGNQKLMNLDGMSNLNSINGGIYLYNNSSLTSIKLDSLNSISGVGIHYNNSLENLDIFSNVNQAIDSIHISRNDSLSMCCMIEDALSNASSVKIYSNAPGCNSIQEIEDSCSFASNENVAVVEEELDTCGVEGQKIYLSNQSEVDAWDKTCDVLRGDLDISGCTNLDSLLGLKSVLGFMRIHSESLKSLSGLDSLKFIGNGIRFDYNDSLKDMTGLGNLEYVGSNFNVSGNEGIENFRGLESLNYIEGDLYIQDNESLLNFTGLESLSFASEWHVNYNNSIENLIGLESLDSVNQIYISGNESLTSLEGIQNIEKVIGGVVISNNSQLSTCCQVLPFIESGSNTIRNNAPGCNSIQEIEDSCSSASNENVVVVEEELDTCGVEGQRVYFTQQSHVDAWNRTCDVYRGDIDIRNCLNLDSLLGLKAVLGELAIGNNPSMTSLSGLDSLSYVRDEFYVNYNGITSLHGLENLDSVNGLEISIGWNPALRTLDGIENLKKVDSWIWVVANDTLEDITALGNVEGFTKDLIVGENPLLTTCCSVLPLMETANQVSFYSNAIGCNSEQEVEGNCEPINSGNDNETATSDTLYYSDTIYVCSGDSISIHGVMQSDASEYQMHYVINDSIDSISTITLVEYPIYSDTIARTIDAGDSIFLAGGYQKVEGTYVDTFQSKNGCDSISTTLLTVNDQDIVWPGDCDVNGVANIYDVLPIGMLYGSQGQARDSVSIMWEGKRSAPWNVFYKGNDLNNVDANGDGLIDKDDAQAILQNYGQTHSRSISSIANVGGAQLRVDFIDNVASPSDEVEMVVSIGEKTLDELDLYAVAFEIDYDESIQSISEVKADGSWLGTENSDMMAFDKILDDIRRVAIVQSRINHVNEIGGGEISRIMAVVDDDIVGGRDEENKVLFIPTIVNAVAITKDDSIVPLNVVVDTLQIEDTATSVNELDLSNEVHIYPNPANNQLTIDLGMQTEGKIQLFNAVGMEVYSDRITNAHQWTVDVSQLPTSVYYVQIALEEGVATKRIVVQH